MSIIKKNLDKIVTKQKLSRLSSNPNVIDLLFENPDKIYWNKLSYNINPDAIELFRKHPEKFKIGNIDGIATNPNATELIKKHIKIIDPINLSKNPLFIKNLAKRQIKYWT